jgi:hypothetical protein
VERTSSSNCCNKPHHAAEGSTTRDKKVGRCTTQVRSKEKAACGWCRCWRKSSPRENSCARLASCSATHSEDPSGTPKTSIPPTASLTPPKDSNTSADKGPL